MFRRYWFLLLAILVGGFILKSCSENSSPVIDKDLGADEEPYEVIYAVEEAVDKNDRSSQHSEPTVESDNSLQKEGRQKKKGIEVTLSDEKLNRERVSERCLKLVPVGIQGLCSMMKSPLAYECIKYFVDSGFGVDASIFDGCNEVKDRAEVGCLATLKTTSIRGCLGVRTKLQVQCLDVAGFGYKRECLKIDTLTGLECIKVLEEKRWRHLHEICHLVTDTEEIQCLKAAELPMQTVPCYPSRRYSSKTSCRGITEVIVEEKKLIADKVDGNITIAYGTLVLDIRSGVTAEPPVKVFRGAEVKGMFSQVLGQGRFGLIYNDRNIELVKSASGPFIKDFRSEKLKGSLDWREGRQICQRRRKNPKTQRKKRK